MQPLDSFKKVYDLSVAGAGRRVPVIERYLGIESASTISVDDQRNQPAIYTCLAHDDSALLDHCFSWLVSELRAVPYDRADPILDGLGFLQSVAAEVLWRYDSAVSERIEAFIREFDRLDLPGERLRLYQAAMNADSGST